MLDRLARVSLARRSATEQAHGSVCPTDLDILRLLLVDEGAFFRFGDVATALGIPRQRAYYSLIRLVIRGLVTEAWTPEPGLLGPTMEPRWVVTDAGRDALAEVVR